MILGYQYSLVPEQTQLRAEVTEELTLDIALDPTLTPVENANSYFDKYHHRGMPNRLCLSASPPWKMILLSRSRF